MKRTSLILGLLLVLFGTLTAQTYTTEYYHKKMKEIFKGTWNCYYMDYHTSPVSKKLISKNITFSVDGLWAQAKFNYVIDKVLISEIILDITANGASSVYQLFYTSISINVNVIEKKNSGVKCLSHKTDKYFYSMPEPRANGKLELIDLRSGGNDVVCGNCCALLFERVSE